MAITARCSHCRTALRVPDAMSGKKAKCPKCGQIFQVASITDEDDGAVRASAPRPTSRPKNAVAGPVSAPAARRRVRREDDDEEAPRARSKRKRRKQASNQGLIVGLSVGGGVLALSGIVIAVAMATAKGRVVEQAPILQVAHAAPAPPAEVVAAAAAKVEPVPQPVAPPAPVAEPEKPAPAPVVSVPQPPAPAPETPSSLTGGKLVPGAKITVRAQIQGSPPKFQGDFNKHVVQNIEIALRNLGYEPVPDGGLILQVNAQIGPAAGTIKVRTIGASPPPPPPAPRPVRPIKGAPPPPPPQPVQPQPPREQTYSLEQITASFVLTDMRGSALWKKDKQFASGLRVFRTTDPPGEMREQLWRAFDGWAGDDAIATMK